jgi:hypothetical protein
VPTMIVLVNLKEAVAPEEYEHWLEERYVPAILDMESEQVQRLLAELGHYADVTQLMTERFV